MIAVRPNVDQRNPHGKSKQVNIQDVLGQLVAIIRCVLIYLAWAQNQLEVSLKRMKI